MKDTKNTDNNVIECEAENNVIDVDGVVNTIEIDGRIPTIEDDRVISAESILNTIGGYKLRK